MDNKIVCLRIVKYVTICIINQAPSSDQVSQR